MCECACKCVRKRPHMLVENECALVGTRKHITIPEHERDKERKNEKKSNGSLNEERFFFFCLSADGYSVSYRRYRCQYKVSESLSVCLSICLPACLPACLTVCLPASLPVCLSVSPSLPLSSYSLPPSLSLSLLKTNTAPPPQ